MLSPEITTLLTQFGYDPASVEALLAGAVYLTLASVIAAIPTGMIARRKRRSVTGWVVLALSIPLLPLLLVWLLPARNDD